MMLYVLVDAAAVGDEVARPVTVVTNWRCRFYFRIGRFGGAGRSGVGLGIGQVSILVEPVLFGREDFLFVQV
jgi:hypothetical protein